MHFRRLDSVLAFLNASSYFEPAGYHGQWRNSTALCRDRDGVINIDFVLPVFDPVCVWHTVWFVSIFRRAIVLSPLWPTHLTFRANAILCTFLMRNPRGSATGFPNLSHTVIWVRVECFKTLTKERKRDAYGLFEGGTLEHWASPIESHCIPTEPQSN